MGSSNGFSIWRFLVAVFSLLWVGNVATAQTFQVTPTFSFGYATHISFDVHASNEQGAATDWRIAYWIQRTDVSPNQTVAIGIEDVEGFLFEGYEPIADPGDYTIFIYGIDQTTGTAAFAIETVEVECTIATAVSQAPGANELSVSLGEPRCQSGFPTTFEDYDWVYVTWSCATAGGAGTGTDFIFPLTESSFSASVVPFHPTTGEPTASCLLQYWIGWPGGGTAAWVPEIPFSPVP